MRERAEPELIRRRIRNIDWPRFLIVNSQITTLGLFLIVYGSFLRFFDSLGLDTEPGQVFWGELFGHLLSLAEEGDELIEEASQEKS